MNITGKLHAIMDIQQVSPTFRKREFVVEYADNPMYPQFISFQLIQEKVELVSGYQIGDMIDVSFNLRGRQWNSPSGETKFFNSLDAWRINPAQPQMAANNPAAAQPNMAAPAAPSPAAGNAPAVDVTSMNDEDDLPF